MIYTLLHQRGGFFCGILILTCLLLFKQISDPNSHPAITLGDQPHHPQFMSYEKGPETTGDERAAEFHTPASATRIVKTMRAEELTERLRRVREQRRASSPTKPTPRQRQRRTQKQTQPQMQTPEEDQDQDLVPIKLCDSPLLAAQARILQTLSKITVEGAESLSFSGSQIPSPSTTPHSGTSEGYLKTGGTNSLNPHAQDSAGDEWRHLATRDLSGDSGTEDEARSATEDSFMQENCEVQRVYHNLHVSLHDIEGDGQGHGGHHGMYYLADDRPIRSCNSSCTVFNLICI